MNLVLWVAAVALLALAGYVGYALAGPLGQRLLHSRRAARLAALEECPLCDEGRGAPIPRRREHVFVERWDETALGGPGAASGVTVAYCGRHCPGGGCSKGCA